MVRQWILKDVNERSKFAHFVLHAVRFPLMTAEYVMCVVTNNDVFNFVVKEHVGQFSVRMQTCAIHLF